MKKDLAQLGALAIFATAVWAIQHHLRADDVPEGSPLVRDLQSTDIETARAAFESLMAANGVADVPALTSARETLSLAFTKPGDVALLLAGCRAGGGRLYVFDADGALVYTSGEYCSIHASRAADLNGDGLDEILFHTCGGGTGLSIRSDVVVTSEGGRPREIFSVMSDVTDSNFTYHGDIRYDLGDDGSVTAIIAETMGSIRTECRHLWRAGADRFVPVADVKN